MKLVLVLVLKFVASEMLMRKTKLIMRPMPRLEEVLNRREGTLVDVDSTNFEK